MRNYKFHRASAKREALRDELRDELRDSSRESRGSQPRDSTRDFSREESREKYVVYASPEQDWWATRCDTQLRVALAPDGAKRGFVVETKTEPKAPFWADALRLRLKGEAADGLQLVCAESQTAEEERLAALLAYECFSFDEAALVEAKWKCCKGRPLCRSMRERTERLARAKARAKAHFAACAARCARLTAEFWRLKRLLAA